MQDKLVTDHVVLNNWCVKKIGSCQYNVLFNNTLTQQEQIFENITGVRSIYNYDDIIGNLIIYTESDDLRSNTIFNDYSTTTVIRPATSTVTTTPTSTVTTTPTSTATSTTSVSTLPLSQLYLHLYSHHRHSNYDPEIDSNQTYINCSSCDDNNNSNSDERMDTGFFL